MVTIALVAWVTSLPAAHAETVQPRVYRYSVQGRGNVSDLEAFAAAAAETYADPRGWNRGGTVRFERVASGGDFTLWLAAAGLVAIAFRGAAFFTMNSMGRSAALPFVAYGLPLSAILLFSWLLITGRQLRVPQRFVDGASSAFASFERRRLALQLWWQGYRRTRAEGGA